MGIFIEMRKKRKSQVMFRKTVFQFDQYWSIHYTEKYSDGKEKDFKAVIKARSSELAKEILIKKTKEDFPAVKVKAITAFMFHKDGEINGIHLNMDDWALIRQASFPNEVNIIFKYSQPRPKGYSNRFNKMSGSRTGLFKKGNDFRRNNYHKQYTRKEKSKMIFKGKWVPWSESEREALKERIIFLFKAFGNNRTVVSERLGLASTKSLKKLLCEKFIEIDWEKDFPPPEPSLRLGRSPLAEQNRVKNLRKRKSKDSQIYYESLLPEVKLLFEGGMPRYKIAKKLKSSKRTINNVLKYAKIPFPTWRNQSAQNI